MHKLMLFCLLFCLLFMTACPRNEATDCYEVEYIHISGARMTTTLDLTATERERLHADNDEGSYFITVAEPGAWSYRSEIVINGATILTAIAPCK